MNVNGSRFDLLLGRADWGRCLDGDGDRARTVASWWDGAVDSPPVELPARLPAWDAQRAELTLPPLAVDLPGTPGEARLEPEARRGAAADRHGNVYRIGSDRATLHVTSSGTRGETPFWPAGPEACETDRERARLDFGSVEKPGPAAPESYLALAVTSDDYLVVAFAAGDARGFLSFDLVAGGPPVRTLWPGELGFQPVDMAPRGGGGVWVLDRTARGDSRLLWELDCRLAVVSTAQPAGTLAPAEPDDFQPLEGAPRERPAVTFPGGVELAGTMGWTVEPVAVEVLGEASVLLLDVDPADGRSRVVRVRRDSAGWSADASRWLDELPDPAHDFVFATAPLYGHEERVERLFIATTRGNQARAYAVTDSPASFELQGATELFPLRLYGGRALLSIRGAASYDSGIAAPAWTPIVHQPRARFGQVAELVTPVFDSRDLGTTWDRLLLDGCVPPDATIEIHSRAGDERADLLDGSASPGVDTPQVLGAWLPEPRPHLRASGPELPWLRAEAAPATRRDAGVGTWEVLLQNARGRYLQLRLRLASASGIATPRVRALRVWSPRFSYARRFLPAVYREDEASGSLLERWLANCESTLTGIEDRVVNAQALFDPRAAPAEALAWLAEWLDVAFDPRWDERRRRLFVEHAMEFFRWRGTVHGLLLALGMAFDRCIGRAAFRSPDTAAEGPRGVRVVEAFQTRLVGALAAGDPGAQTGLRQVKREALWTPAEGNAGLVDRWAAAQGRKATAAEEATPFSLVAPEEVGPWREFVEAALGFVPAIGAAERALWQRFLSGRYESVAALRAAHGTGFSGFGGVTLPRDWPAAEAYQGDWTDFSGHADGAWMRRRWQDFLARRHRRIERLNRAWETAWPEFAVVAIPDAVPETAAAQADWLQFERQVLGMHRTAHRFSVLLPVADVAADPYELQARLGLARRIVELEKPAHTVFDVRYYWAFFRVGEARLEADTQIGAGSRAPELIPDAVLGRAYIGASFIGGAATPTGGDRLVLTC
jgi:phage tail-like protein